MTAGKAPNSSSDGQGGLEQAVEGEERVGQRDPAHDRARHVALVPLVAGQLADHRGVPAQDHEEAVDPLGRAGVHLVRHRRRPDLARPEALGHQLVAGHQPDRGGERGRPGAELDECREHVEVERAGVDLAHAGEDGREAEMVGDRRLEPGELVLVAVEQVEHVLRGADRALDAAQRIAGEQVVEATHRDEQFVGDGGEPLAERGRLRGDVVRAARHHQRVVLTGPPGQPGQYRERLVPHDQQRLPQLQLLDVLGQVTAGHALVDLLVPGELGELLDACLHVVPGHPLAGGDAVEVDRGDALVDDALVGLDRLRRNRDAEFGLRAEHGEPQLALGDDLVFRRPDRGHRARRVPCREHVRDHRFGHAHQCPRNRVRGIPVEGRGSADAAA